MHIIEAMQVTYRAGSSFRNRMNILTILSKSENVQMFLVFFSHTAFQNEGGIKIFKGLCQKWEVVAMCFFFPERNVLETYMGKNTEN